MSIEDIEAYAFDKLQNETLTPKQKELLQKMVELVADYNLNPYDTNEVAAWFVLCSAHSLRHSYGKAGAKR